MRLVKLAQAIKRRDPAMRSWFELILYPGFWVMVFHWPAHGLYKLRLFFLARLLSQLSRGLTGIEIHPGVRMGEGVFIDHGYGVVLGETCVIGNNVLIYHGVTLGATGNEPDKNNRHPHVGDDVVIGCGALVLGNIKIGNGAKIGAGTLVVSNVPEGGTVVGEPGRLVGKEASLRKEIAEVKHRVEELELHECE